jgi:AcrR family transcriptional regulator
MAELEAKEQRVALSAKRIELAALDLINRDGLAEFSTRKLAKRLGCEAMSIYHYYPSKTHLLNALVDRVIGSLTVMHASGKDWRKDLEFAAREWRAMAVRHPGFFPFIAVHRLDTRLCLRWLNGMLSVFYATGLDEGQATRAFRSMGYYLIGVGLDEGSAYSEGQATATPVPAEDLLHHYPSVARAGKYLHRGGFDKTFEFGLKYLLDGIERMLPRRATSGG